MSEHSRSIAIQTARIVEEIERTRRICARTLELLREPLPSTFLGNKIDQGTKKWKTQDMSDAFLGCKTQEPFPKEKNSIRSRPDRNVLRVYDLGGDERRTTSSRATRNTSQSIHAGEGP